MQTVKVRLQTNSKLHNHKSLDDKEVHTGLVSDILQALKNVRGYGSIEIYVQDNNVTQITVRNIKKMRHVIAQ